MLCIQYQYQEMGLVFPALPEEFLHGLEKTATHLRVKGGLGISCLLLKLQPMKTGNLFSWLHVLVSVVQSTPFLHVPLHRFLFIFIFFNKRT